MKIAPVSGDLLVKLGLGVVAFGGLAMLIYTWKSEASAAAGAAANALDYVNPNSTQNAVYGTVNGFWDTVLPEKAPGRTADGAWSVGAFVYDVTHPFTAWQVANVTAPTGGGRTPQITPIGPQYDQLGNVIYN